MKSAYTVEVYTVVIKTRLQSELISQLWSFTTLAAN